MYAVEYKQLQQTRFLVAKGFQRRLPCPQRVQAAGNGQKGENLVFLQGDLQDAEIFGKIKEHGPFSLVVCDAAPLTTGNRTVDTARSLALVKMAIWYAETMLSAGGSFCVKLFQNGEQQKMLQKMRGIFTTAKGFKPEACRASSFETYLIGLGKRSS